MRNVIFNTIPTDVPLTTANIDRLADRAAELATAFAARIASIQKQVTTHVSDSAERRTTSFVRLTRRTVLWPSSSQRSSLPRASPNSA
ncbi:hypothetical protein ACM9XB_13410 [Xanthomonas sacchari]